MSVFSKRRQRPSRPVRRALTAAAPELAANEAPTQAIRRPAGPTLGELAACGEIPPHPFMPGRIPVACRCGQPRLAAIHSAPPRRRPSFTALAKTVADSFPQFLPAIIGDSLRQPPPWSPPAPKPPGTDVVLYAGPGWTRALDGVRRRNGELEELPALIEQGHGRNAAEFHTAIRHAHEQMVQRAVDLCASLGCADMAGELLRRVQWFNEHPDIRDGRAA